MSSLVAFDTPQGRLHLRSPELSDLPNLVARGQDRACVGLIPGLRDSTITLESTRQYIEDRRRDSSVKDLFVVIVRKADGRVIGDGGFEALDLAEGTGSAGIMLDSGVEVRGRGYAVEAMGAVFGYGFERLGLRRIFVRTLKVNAPMRGVMERRFGLVAVERERGNEVECRFTLEREDWRVRLRGEGLLGV